MNLKKPGRSSMKPKFVTSKLEKNGRQGMKLQTINRIRNRLKYFRDDENFASGFKNQGPYYQEATKFVGGDVMCWYGQGHTCTVITSRTALLTIRGPKLVIKITVLYSK